MNMPGGSPTTGGSPAPPQPAETESGGKAGVVRNGMDQMNFSALIICTLPGTNLLPDSKTLSGLTNINKQLFVGKMVL